jgi:predicted ABC-type ATPase
MISILICGPSGVGKSSNLSHVFNHLGIQELELFDPDKRLEKTQEERSSKTREEVHNAIGKKSFVYSGSCLRGKAMEEIIEKLHSNNYRIILVMFYTSVNTAIKRIKERKEQPVPENIIREFHKLFTKKAEKYMNNKLINEILLYNNESKLLLLLDKKDKKIHCYKKEEKFYFDISPYCSSSI